MGSFCDLHTHSIYSDGTDTPAQLLQGAQRIGLSALALTDHNTVAGLPAFLEAAKESCVEAIPGVEFSADYNGGELHILALGVQEGYFSQVTDLMEQYRIRKEESNRNLASALNRAGYAIDYDAIRASTPNGEVNRALFAVALMNGGYAQSVQEAFGRFLHPKCGFYVPPQRYSPEQMLGIIRDLGAVSVLAHPLLNLTPQQLRDFLEQMRPNPLVGMEVHYSTYSPEETKIAATLAAEFGILPSGGSDYHGSTKPDIRLGEGKGNLQISYALWDALKNKKKL